MFDGATGFTQDISQWRVSASEGLGSSMTFRGPLFRNTFLGNNLAAETKARIMVCYFEQKGGGRERESYMNVIAREVELTETPLARARCCAPPHARDTIPDELAGSNAELCQPVQLPDDWAAGLM